MSDEPVLLQEDGDAVRLLTLNRPSALNALNSDLWEATAAAFDAAATDDSVSVVVLTGAGRAFTAGQDMKEMLDPGRKDRGGVRELAAALARFPKPFVCAVNGIAVGGGGTILGMADLVFMSSDARVRYPFTSLGIVPELGSSATLPRLIGRQNAMWALLSSEWLSASQCLDMGLAFAVCDADALLEEAMAHARILAAHHLDTLVEGKRLLRATWAAEVDEALARESDALRKMAGGPANKAAVDRFLGK